MLETDWMDILRQKHPHGRFLFLAEGVMMYFNEEQVKSVIQNLAQRFPGCEIYFDFVSKCGGEAPASTDDRNEKAPLRAYGVFPSSKNGTVVEWLVLAAGEIRRIWSEGKLPVVCGGTGLYIDNLINGTTPIPEAEPEVRHKVAEAAAAEGIPALHARLSTVDAVTADRLSPNDSTRVKRALEVFYQTGVPLSVWHRRPMVQKLKKEMITGEDLKAGDVLIGMASSGVHSNGFSLVRKVFEMTKENLETYHESLQLRGSVRTGSQPHRLADLGGQQRDEHIRNIGKDELFDVDLLHRSSSFRFALSTTAA